MIPWLSIEKIDQSDILVVGAGALGNEVSKNLALSGFHNITIVDMDRIEISNLNRCIFFSDEDGEKRRYKSETLASRIRSIDKNLNVTHYNKKIQDLPEDFIPSFDIVFGCIDNLKTRLHLNAFCYYHLIPYVDGATFGFCGKVQVVMARDTPCLECSMNGSHMKVLENRYSCTGSEITYFDHPLPSEITTTSVIAAVQVREGLKIASDKDTILKNHVFYYNGENNRSEEIKIEINPLCQHHNFV